MALAAGEGGEVEDSEEAGKLVAARHVVEAVQHLGPVGGRQ